MEWQEEIDIRYSSTPLFRLRLALHPLFPTLHAAEAAALLDWHDTTLLFLEWMDSGFTQACSIPTQFPSKIELDPRWLPLIERLVADGHSASEITFLFSRLGASSYSPAYMAKKVEELHGAGGIALPRTNDAETLLPDGYVQPLSSISAQGCYEFLQTHNETLATIRQQYGVPSSVIVSILFIETGLGTNLGCDPALRSLGSMAATNSVTLLGSAGNSRQIARISPGALQTTLQNKSAWAYKELQALIAYGKKSGMDIASIPGSMYGAIGLCQFMPSNIEPYAVDGDEDGTVDLFSIVDAMYSVASFLEAHGWRGAKSEEAKMRVIMQYNQDAYYARQVLGVAAQVALAEQGKLGRGRNPLAVSGSRQKRLDPSLRRQGFVPRSARVKSLDGYRELLD